MKKMVKAIGSYLGGSKVRKALVRTLALVVVFATTYSLVLPAITKTVANLAGELDGVSVRIEADGRAVPADTTMALKRVLLPGDPETDDSAALRRLTDDEVELIRAAALDGDESMDAEILRVLDIALEYNGNEIEPSKAVRLVLQSELIRDAARPAIVHLDDNGAATLLAVQGEDGEVAIQLGEDEVQPEPGESVQEPEEGALPELPGEDESSEPAQEVDGEESGLPAVDADEQESAEPEQNDSEETADEPEEALETPDMPEEQEDDSAETSEPAEDADDEIAAVTEGFSVYAIVDLTPKAEQPDASEASDETEEPAETIEFSDSVGGMDVYVNASVTAFPEGTSMVVSLVDAEDVFDTVSETVGGEIGIVQAVDITFYNADGEEIEPSEPISVVIKPQTAIDTENSKLVHIGENETTVVENAEFERDQVSFDSGEFSTYVIIITLGNPGEQVYHGDGFTVTVTYGSDAGLPTGTVMTLKEIEEGSADYQEYFERTEKALNLDPSEVDPADVSVEDQLDLLLSGGYELKSARFYDIELRYNGKKIEPAAPVNVEIRYDDAAMADEDGTVKIVHFADSGTETIHNVDVDSSNGGAVVTYQQDSFSVSATVIAEQLGNGGWIRHGRMQIHYGRNGRDVFEIAFPGFDNGEFGGVAPTKGAEETWYLPGDNAYPDKIPNGAGGTVIAAGMGVLNEGTTVEQILKALAVTTTNNRPGLGVYWHDCGRIDFIFHKTYTIDENNWKANGSRKGGLQETEVWTGECYWLSDAEKNEGAYKNLTWTSKAIVVKRADDFTDTDDTLVKISAPSTYPVHFRSGVVIDNNTSKLTTGAKTVADQTKTMTDAQISKPVAIEVSGTLKERANGTTYYDGSLLMMEVNASINDTAKKSGSTSYGTGVLLTNKGSVEFFNSSMVYNMAVAVEQKDGKTRLKTSAQALALSNGNTLGVALWPGQSIGKWTKTITGANNVVVPVFLRNVESWKSGDIVMDSGRYWYNEIAGQYDQSNPQMYAAVKDGDKAVLKLMNPNELQTVMGLEFANGSYDGHTEAKYEMKDGKKEYTDLGIYPVIRFYIGTVLNTRTGKWYSTLGDAVQGKSCVSLGDIHDEPGDIQDGDTLVFFGSTLEKVDIEIRNNLTIRSSFSNEEQGNNYPVERAGKACTATLDGVTITVAAGKTVTFGSNVTTNKDGTQGTVSGNCGGLTLDGNSTSANIITNNGTLNLKDGITLTKAKNYAVYQNGEFHLYEGAKFESNGTDVFLVSGGKVEGNHFITLETMNPNKGENVTVALGANATQFNGRDVVVEGNDIRNELTENYLNQFPLKDLYADEYEYVYNQTGGPGGVCVLELKQRDTLLIKIHKVDENGAPLADAKFTIKNQKDGTDYYIAAQGNKNPYVTDASGDTEITVREGNFTLTEVAPAGYDGAKDIKFTVKKVNDKLTLDGDGFTLVNESTYTITVENRAKTANVTLVKVDAQGNKLNGVTFTLGGKAVTTGADGTVSLGEFTYGKTYELIETWNNPNYQKLSGPINLTVGVDKDGKLTLTTDYAGNAVKIAGNEQSGFTVTVTNDPSQVQVRLYKTDGSSKPLAGATFELRDGNNVIGNGTSGADGYIENGVWSIDVDKTYTLVETETPAGYRAMAGNTTIRVNANGSVTLEGSALSSTTTEDGVIVITVINNPGAELPHTGGMGTTVYTFTGIALAMGAALLMIEVKKRGRERA